MKRSGVLNAAVLVVALALTGCAQRDGGGAVEEARSIVTPPDRPQVPDHLIYDTGVEGAPCGPLPADWSVNVNDPAVLREFSSAVISGRVIGAEPSFVSLHGLGTIATSYTVQVEHVYKGEDIADLIAVTLPGGSVSQSDYNAALELLWPTDAGSNPYTGADPSKSALMPPVIANYCTNPASESALTKLQPDFWVFYLGATEGAMYYGAAFDHALSYLKDGQVFSLHAEAERSPIPESELLGG